MKIKQFEELEQILESLNNRISLLTEKTKKSYRESDILLKYDDLDLQLKNKIKMINDVSSELNNVKNDIHIIDTFMKSLNLSESQLKNIHEKNSDLMLAEGTSYQVSANELRNHIDNHPREITDEEKSQIILIKDKVDKISGKGLSSNDFTDSYIDKINTSISKINDMLQRLDLLYLNKVDKELGKGLSSNDFTNELRAKIYDVESFSHVKDTDNSLAKGTPSQVTADELRNHIDNHPIFNDQKLQQDILKLKDLLLNKVDKIEGKGLSTNDFDNKSKNDLNQLLVSINTFNEYLSNKVDKELGKGLSSNDFTNDDKDNISNLASNIEILSNNIAILSQNKVDKETGKGLSSNDFTNDDKALLSSIKLNLDNINIIVGNISQNKVDKIEGKGLSTNDFTNEYKQKIESFDTDISNKVNKIEGKGLSTNDFTDIDKNIILENKNNITTLNSSVNLIEGDLLDITQNKVDKELGKGLSSNDFTNFYKDKIDTDLELCISELESLSNSISNLLKNSHIKNTDTILAEGTPSQVTADEIRYHLNNHPTITDEEKSLISEIPNKVDKETGKGLSSNDFTNDDKDDISSLKNISHMKNKDIMLAEGTSEQVSANELRNHIDNHPSISNIEKSLISEVPNKVDKETGKGLSSNDFTNDDKLNLDNLILQMPNKVDKETGKGLSSNDFTNDDKTKLDNISLQIPNKVDKETGKGLSSNDFTNDDKTKLDSLVLQIPNKVDKIEGKGLSSNDFTDTQKSNIQFAIDSLLTKVDKIDGKVLSSNDFTDLYKQEVDNLVLQIPTKVDKEAGKGLSSNDFTNLYKQEVDSLVLQMPNKVDKEIGRGLSSNDFTNDDKTKLDSLSLQMPNKVDKESGKGLSSNDFTNDYKTKLDGISGSNTGDETYDSIISKLGYTPINQNLIAEPLGLATLDENGKLSSSQRPIEKEIISEDSIQNFPEIGIVDKIYIAKDTNITYVWNGSEYTEISKSLAIGNTASSAFRGDYGQIAYNHSLESGNPHGTTKNDIGLGNVKNIDTTLPENINWNELNRTVTDSEKVIWNGKANTNTATQSVNGLMSSTDKTKLDGIASNANNYVHPTSGVTAGTYKSVTVNAQGHITSGSNPTTLSGYGITDAGITWSKNWAFINPSDNLKYVKIATFDMYTTINFTLSYLSSYIKGSIIRNKILIHESNLTGSKLHSIRLLRSNSYVYELDISFLRMDSEFSYILSFSSNTSNTIFNVEDTTEAIDNTYILLDEKIVEDLNTERSQGTYTKFSINQFGNIVNLSSLDIADIPQDTNNRFITDSERILWNNKQTGSNDLTAISNISNSSGLLKKVSSGNWVLDNNTYLTANQNISITGDATGNGNTNISLTLANSGVTAGTYSKVTVDAKGRVTAGTILSATDVPVLDWSKITTGKPTTLSGYGITDAILSTDVVTTPTANKILKLDTNAKLPANITGNADGNAATATKLLTTRTLTLGLSGKTFDGSANVSWTLAEMGAVALTDVAVGNSVGKIVQRDGSGDVICRLVRAEYADQATISGGLVFRTAGGSGTDNYLRVCNNVSAIRTFLGTPSTAIATTSTDGLLSSTDKTKLDGIASNANNYIHPVSGVTASTYKSVTVDANGHITSGSNPTTLSGYGITDATPSSHVGSTGTAHGVVTTSVNGFMSSTDKTKLDGIANNANNYVHPTSGVTASTYKSVTVDVNGHITSGSNPTTLSGYGITDAVKEQNLVGSVSLTANSWYRIATSDIDIKHCHGTFKVDWSVSNYHGIAVFDATAMYGQSSGSTIQQQSFSIYGGGITEARIVYHTTYSGNYAYVEVKSNTTIASVTMSVSLIDSLGWTLLGSITAGSIPTGYTSYIHTFTSVSSITSGAYQKVTINQEGRVISGSGLSASDIPSLDASKITSGTLGLNTTGNAATATKLLTARTLTLGLSGKTFDGSANVSWTLAEMGAVALTDVTTANTVSKVVQRDSNGDIAVRLVRQEYADQATISGGLVFRTNNTTDNFLRVCNNPSAIRTFLGTPSTDVATQSVNGLLSSTDKTKLDGIASNANNYTHPVSGVSAGSYTKVTVDTNGHVTVGASLSASDIPSHDHTSITGNSATATKLQTARTINGVSFDGSANITINAIDSTSRIASSEKGAVNGVATLDSTGKVPASQLPSYVDDVLEYTNFAGFPATGEIGKIYVDLATNKCYRWGGSAYVYITSGSVDSVNGKTGVVTLSKTDVGLGNVANVDTSNPANITWTASYRTVTDTEKTTWNSKQAGSADLTSIAGLAGTTGLLKKTASGVWTLDTNAYLTANQTVTVSGDATGSGTTAIALTLANSGATAGTYKSVTVDAKGRVTAGTNPTTLSGYGITDAVSTSQVSASSTASKVVQRDGNGDIAVRLVRQEYADQATISGGLVFRTNNTTDNFLRVCNNPSAIRTFLGTPSTAVATTSVNGLMSSTDKTKLDGLSNYTHPASGVTAGTYKSVTVDANGHITSGSNPTTLSGYGITDAVSSSDSRLTDARPASDVYAWAKASTKPSYTYSEVGAVPQRTRTNWHSDDASLNSVVGQLAWRGKGNGYTIFDASAGTAPGGTFVHFSNPIVSWSPGYPTLMGWDGTNTCGVRVQTASSADSLMGYTINSSGIHNVANEIVRTDSNGYIQAGLINTTSGDNGTTAISRIYASSDGYIRYYTPANFISTLNLVEGNDARLSDARTPLSHVHSVATQSTAGFMSAADKATLDSISLTAGNTISYASVSIDANASATVASLRRQSCKIQVLAYGAMNTVSTTGRYAQSPYIDLDNGTEGCIYEFSISEISKTSYKWTISRGVNSRDYIGSFSVALIDDGNILNLIAKPSSAVQVRVTATYF